MRANRTVLAGALVAATATGAAADPTEVGPPRMTVPAKQGVLHAMLELSLSKDAAFEPVSLAPDLWYGVNPKLTVGLVHSGRAAAGFFGGAGDGLCLTGEDHGCAKVYDSTGLLARYHLKDGPFTVALDGGLLVRSYDPFTVALKLGIAGRWQRGKLALDLAPNLAFGLSERDSGNTEQLDVPVTLSYAVAPRLALALQSGVATPVEDLIDNVVIPLSAGGQVLVNDKLFVDVVFSLPRWLDTVKSTNGLDARTLTLGVGYAF